MSPDDAIAALDVGDRRVGVAMTRVMTGLPQPALTLNHDEQIWQRISDFIQQNEVSALVVGLPRGLDGQETGQTKKVRDFIGELKKHVNVPVYPQDEAVTSVKAEDELRARGIRYNKGMVDALAATFILEDFLRGRRKGDA